MSDTAPHWIETMPEDSFESVVSRRFGRRSLLKGAAAVGAVAFFAAWSVLSNFFCALLIFTARPFRLGDHIEVIDGFDKPGARGRVIDINMLYTTIEDSSAGPGAPALLQVPNTQIFQKTVRRWLAPPPPLPPPPPPQPSGPEDQK